MATHKLILDNGELKRVPIDEDLVGGQVAIDTSKLELILNQFASDFGMLVSQMKASPPQIQDVPAGTPIFDNPTTAVDVGVVLASRRCQLMPYGDHSEYFYWKGIRGANTIGFILHNRAAFSIELNNHGRMSKRYTVVSGMVPVFDIPENRHQHACDHTELEIRFQSDRSWNEQFDFTIVIGRK